MSFFFFNDTATTEIYTLSLHDALPISRKSRFRLGGASGCSPTCVGVFPGRDIRGGAIGVCRSACERVPAAQPWRASRDRKSTRLNSSHANISYAVFCLKKKKTRYYNYR